MNNEKRPCATSLSYGMETKSKLEQYRFLSEIGKYVEREINELLEQLNRLEELERKLK
ncbi:MAG: hypothetical protein LBL90_13375 [Prevotellaceae bacterium]|jgi:hypothetical protein|nr:hypothetical protein [Prevotellaceae bacterium]